MTDLVRRPLRRILIIKPSSLGDVIHALPILAALRRAHPHAHIAWLVGKTFVPLLENHPLLDEVISFDRRRFGRMLQSATIFAEFTRFVQALRHRRFDAVIDLQGLARSGFMAYATGADTRIGFADAREMAWTFYSRRVRCPRTVAHAVDKNAYLARSVGLPVDPLEFPLGITATDRARAQQLLEERAGESIGRFTAILPGTRWESKQWHAGGLASVVRSIAQEGFPRPVLLGGPDDRPISDQIVEQSGVAAVNLAGRTTLRELAALLSLSTLVVCHDSGPMHIAAALRKPIAAIFGPTNPARTGPYARSASVVALPLECVPCYRRRCPLGHHACMRTLDPESVMQAVRQVAGKTPLDSLNLSPPSPAQNPPESAGIKPLA